MTWGAIGSAVIGVAGNAILSSGGDGGGGSSGGGTTVNKDPWALAQPWLQANLGMGQQLQNQYAANPFSPTQKRAYSLQFANSDYLRQLQEAVAAQANQRQTFNRGRPSVVPQRYWTPPPGVPDVNLGLGQPGTPTIPPDVSAALAQSGYSPQGYAMPGQTQAASPAPAPTQPSASAPAPGPFASGNPGSSYGDIFPNFAPGLSQAPVSAPEPIKAKPIEFTSSSQIYNFIAQPRPSDPDLAAVWDYWNDKMQGSQGE